MFSSEQLKAISAILKDLGQVCIASAVVPFVIPHFISGTASIIFVGALLAILFWTLSIITVKSP